MAARDAPRRRHGGGSQLFRDLPILLFMSGKAGSDAQKKLRRRGAARRRRA
jgi:hypothetical protein